ncbi:MAG: SoxR reducing system RseC family protein [Rikenellaceae bacterium]
MRSGGFHHIGRVLSIEQWGESLTHGVVYVSMESVEACQGCKAKSQCTSMGKSEGGESRVVKVASSAIDQFEVDDSVRVSVTYSIGAMAVVVAYVIPLVILIGMLVVLIGVFDVEQGLSALTTFVTLGIYYGGVYLCRRFFESAVKFNLEKIV